MQEALVAEQAQAEAENKKDPAAMIPKINGIRLINTLPLKDTGGGFL